MQGDLLLVGCGKMGGALLEGWIAQRIIRGNIWVIEPYQAARQNLDIPGLHFVKDASQLPSGYKPKVAIIAVKPQSMEEALSPLKAKTTKETTILSIAAGKTIGSYTEIFGQDQPVVRAMPNTPASIGKGITVACPNSYVKEDAQRICTELLQAVGEVLWCEDEHLMDVVTAVSGSGPAYVFLLVEAMAKAGIAMGLSSDMAMQLARSTVAGSGDLMRSAAQMDVQELRKNVTSPAGTTEAALNVLMTKGGLFDLMEQAIKAAAERGKELA